MYIILANLFLPVHTVKLNIKVEKKQQLNSRKYLFSKLCCIHMGLDARKPVFRGFANNKGADQPVHPCSLISAFVICLLESIISRLATSKLSIFYLVSVAEESGLSLILSETGRQVLSRPGPYVYKIIDYSIYYSSPCYRQRKEPVSLMRNQRRKNKR